MLRDPPIPEPYIRPYSSPSTELRAVQIGYTTHDLVKDFRHPIFSKSTLMLNPEQKSQETSDNIPPGAALGPGAFSSCTEASRFQPEQQAAKPSKVFQLPSGQQKMHGHVLLLVESNLLVNAKTPSQAPAASSEITYNRSVHCPSSNSLPSTSSKTWQDSFKNRWLK